MTIDDDSGNQSISDDKARDSIDGSHNNKKNIVAGGEDLAMYR